MEIHARRGLLRLGLVGATCLAVPAAADDKDESEVSAIEDLMREHGVLRRALLIYRHAAMSLRRESGDIDPGVLNRTARLFRAFGEDYHERQLEEAHVFPALAKADSHAIDVLKLQHERGRAITEHIIAQSAAGPLAATRELSHLLDGFVLMYEHHAAYEDTVIIPAWKQAVGKHQMNDMGERFEEIEKRHFGENGFRMALREIGAIEQALGLQDLAQFTMPALRRA